MSDTGVAEDAESRLVDGPAACKPWSTPTVIVSAAGRTDKVPYASETTPGGTSFGPS